MAWYKNYKLVQNGDENIVEIYLNPQDTEFSEEFFSNIKENILQLDDQVKNLMKENFPDVKTATIKIVLGTMIVATIPFMPMNTQAVKAAELTTTSTQQAASTIALNTTGVVLADRLNVRTGPSTSYSAFHTLYKGNIVKVIGQNNGWYQIKLSDGRTGWVSGSYLSLNAGAQAQKISSLINLANSLVGTPYVWGGSSLSDGGFDCSGFTQYIFKQVGYNLNRISSDQATQGVFVSRTAILPGDLIFYSLSGDGRISHVGLYIGNGKMIHSPKTGDTVKVTDITTSYWQSRYMTARRIIQ